MWVSLGRKVKKVLLFLWNNLSVVKLKLHVINYLSTYSPNKFLHFPHLCNTSLEMPTVKLTPVQFGHNILLRCSSGTPEVQQSNQLLTVKRYRNWERRLKIDDRDKINCVSFTFREDHEVPSNLQKAKWKVWEHTLYSPWSPCDFRVFGPLDNWTAEDPIKRAADSVGDNWMDRSVSNEALSKLVQRYEKCRNLFDDRTDK